MPKKTLIDDITKKVTIRFRTFGGGKDSEFNPISHFLRDKPAQFAAGVDVREVVAFIVGAVQRAR